MEISMIPVIPPALGATSSAIDAAKPDKSVASRVEGTDKIKPSMANATNL
jgi:hypothetical protein